MRRLSLTSMPLRLLVLLGGYITLLSQPTAAAQCPQVGDWLAPATADIVADQPALFQRLSQAPVVLLGESHDNAAHHRWQLHTLAALYAYRPQLVVGFEMFPRRLQPVLDRWVAGEYSETEFLKAVEWDQVWGFDPDLYLPLFHFARQQRLPMVALNVERALVRRVGQKGWAAIPAAEREGVGDPRPASIAYRRALAQVYFAKQEGQGHHTAATPAPTPPSSAAETPPDDPNFERFVQAQLTWDRAMAEGLATALERYPDRAAVGIIGQGHLLYGHGVPHQLADLGVANTQILLPVSQGQSCSPIDAEIGDYLHVVPDREASTSADRPRLGVFIEAHERGVRVGQVIPGSVAEATGLQPNDIIVSAAGRVMQAPSDLTTVIGQLLLGTWLPLTIERAGQTLELSAKFPFAEEATASP